MTGVTWRVRLRGRDFTHWPTLGDVELRHGELLTCGPGFAQNVPDDSRSLRPGPHLVGVAGPDSGQLIAFDRTPVTVGRSRHADLVVDDPELSAIHFEVGQEEAGVAITDLGSTNGTFVEEVRLAPHDAHRLQPGDYMTAGSSVFAVVDLGPQQAAVVDGQAAPEVILQRQFRPAETPLTSRLTPPAAPPDHDPVSASWWRSLTPLLTGFGFAVMTGRWEFLIIAALSPLVFFFDARRVKRLNQERHEARRAAHEAECTRFWADVAALRSTERFRLRERATLGGTAAALCRLPHRRMWERQPGDDDFASVDLGLGSQPVGVLAGDDHPVTGPPTHSAVPVVASLPDIGSLAVVGPRDPARAALRAMMLGLATAHAPTELRMWVLCPRPDEASWDFARWLPHVQNDPRSSGTLDRILQDRLDQPGDGSVDIVVVDDRSHLSSESLATLLRSGPERGVFTLVSSTGGAPDGCGGQVTLGSEAGDRASFESTSQPRTEPVTVAEMSIATATAAAVALAPLRPATVDHDRHGPSASLLELHQSTDLDVASIVQNWRHNGLTTEAIVGTTATGPMRIDIARHGPHGLVGGMSGSGKTEFLSTMLASLCLQNHPDDLSVVLVDFKGGVDHALTARLPHVIELSTNLDTARFSRTVELLEAEQRRRQALLSGVAADLDGYRRARAADPCLPAVPRLLVVVDEFSELLADDEGREHLAELVRVTRIGRALGVHLLLVTQSFEGQLPPQIEANAGLRVCLRVTKESHSKAVLGAGDAAHIDERRIGRALARLNGKDLVEFQAARVAGRRQRAGQRSGARHGADPGQPATAAQPPAPVVAHARIGGAAVVRPPVTESCPAEHTDVYALGSALTEAAAAVGWTGSAIPWPSELGDPIPVAHSTGRGDGLQITIGLEDRPDEQRQVPAVIDPTDGDVLLLGGPAAGLSEVLQTVAFSAAAVTDPSRLHLHLIDLEGGNWGPVADLAHSGTVAVRDERLALRLLRQLDHELGARRMARQLGGPTTAAAHQLVLVAGADRLVRRGDDRRHPLLDPLAQLMLDSAGLGMQFVLAGLPTLGDSRLAANAGRRLVFRSNDLRRSTPGVPARLAASLDRRGRAVDVGTGRLIQIGCPGDWGPLTQIEHPEGPAAAVRLTSTDWPLAAPSVNLGRPPAAYLRPLPLAVDRDLGQPVWIDSADDGPLVVVTGPPGSGRTSALVSMAWLAADTGWRCVAVPGWKRSPLASHRPEGETGRFSLVSAPGDLEAAIAMDDHDGRPLAVFIDDLHRLESAGADLSAALPAVVERADIVVVSGSVDFIGGLSPVRRTLPETAVGLLLCPSSALDGQAVGLAGRLSEEQRESTRPGLGLAVIGGEVTSVTVPFVPGP